MTELTEKNGVNSYKYFLSYKGALQLSDEDCFSAMKRAAQIGALSQVHAENGDLVVKGQQKMIELGITGPEGHVLSRPADVEGEATNRVILIAEMKKFMIKIGKLHVDIMSPPLRPEGHNKKLQCALKGGLIDCVGTDHCFFTIEQRKMGKDDFRKIPNGINGVEDRMNLHLMVGSGRITPSDYVRVISTKVAL